jgi:4-hydroxybenzoate polyprenyltransferase
MMHKLIPLISTINIGLALDIGHSKLEGSLFIQNIVPFLMFTLIITLATLGYFINNLADAEEDRIAGKLNASSNIPIVYRVCLLMTILFLSIGETAFIQWLAGPITIWFLYAIHLLASTFYSLKPLRFKTRGAVGLFVVVIAQYTSSILFVLICYNFPLLYSILLVGCFSISGICLEFGHQRSDRESDIMLGSNTFAARRSKRQIDLFYRHLLTADRFSIWITTITYAILLATHSADPRIVMVFIISILFLVKTTIRFHRQDYIENSFQDPYYRSTGDIADTYHTYYPNFVLPLNLCCCLSILRPSLIPFQAIVVLIIFTGHNWHPIRWHIKIWRWILYNR